MKRISRVFRIWMLVAILAGAFSPLTQLELAAEESATPEPTIEVDAIPAEDPTGEQQSPEIVEDDDQAPGQTESPDTIEPLPVMPQPPVVSECGDATAIQLPTSPEGIQYELVETGEGSYIVEARIINPLAFEWAELTDPWNVVDGVAAYPVILKPCVVEDETLESEVNIPKGSDELIDIGTGTPEADSMHQQSSNGPANDSLNIELSVETELDHEGPIEPVDFITYRVHVTLNDESVNYQFTMSWSEGQEYNSIFYPWGVPGTDCNVDDPSRTMTCGIDAGTWVGGINNTQTWLITLRATEDVQNHCALEANFEGSAVQAGSNATWDTNNTAHGSVPTGQPCEPDLSLDKVPNSIKLSAGDTIEYQIVLRNEGFSADGVTLTETLPAELSGYTWSAPGCDIVFPNITCGNLDLGPDDIYFVDVTGIPALSGSAAMCGNHFTSATASHSSTQVGPHEALIHLDCDVDYSWTVSSLSDAVFAGDSTGFLYTFENTGNSAFALQLNDSLPTLPNALLWDIQVSAPSESSLYCNGAESTDFTTSSSIECGVSNLRPGGLVEIKASFAIPDDIGVGNQLCGWITTVATAQFITPQQLTNHAGDLGIITDAQEFNVSTNESGFAVRCVGISVEIDNGIPEDSFIAPGEEITYTVEVVNAGDVEIADYSLFINLDWALTLDQLTTFPAEADCDPLDGVYLDCAVETFAPETTHTYVFTAIANDALTAEQCETGMTTEALLYASQIPDVDQPLIATDVTAIECTAIAHFQMSAVNPTVIPGESIAYTIELENTGTLVLNDIDLGVDLPTLPESGNWITTFDDDAVLLPYHIDTLAPGQSVSFLVESSEIPVDLTLPESNWCDEWTSTATVTGAFSNGDPFDEMSEAQARVNCTGVSIETEISDQLIQPDGDVVLTITVANHGNTVVREVVVEYDTAAASHVFGSWQSDSNACVIDDVIRCHFDEIERFDSRVIELSTVAPKVPALQQCESVDHFASITYQHAEAPMSAPTSVDLSPPNTPIQSNSVSARLDCLPSLELTSFVELVPGKDGRMDAGDTVNYTMTVTNTGNMTIYDATLDMRDSDGIAWSDDGNVINELAPGESANLTAVYTITQADLDAGELSHTMSATGRLEPARITGKTEIHGFGVVMMDAPPLDTVHAEVSVVTALQQVPGMEMNASVDTEEPLGVGDEATFTFMVTNTGNVTLTDLSIASSDVDLVWDVDQVVPVLAPGESASFIASYTVVAEDQDEIVVGAEVSAADPTGVEFTSSQSVTLQIAEVEIPEPTLEPTQEPTPGTIPPTEIPEETPDPTPHVTPDATPGQTSEATPDQSTEVTPAPGSAEPADPSGKQIIELPKTGTGGALGPGQIIWIATVLIAMVFAVTIGSYRRRS